MQISPVTANQPYKANIKFGCVTHTVPKTLKHETSRAVGDVLRAFSDIMSRLESKSGEGLEYVSKNFPDLTIGRGLTFHNCGRNKTSIQIVAANSSRYDDLTRIIVRKGNSTWSERIILDSFMLSGNDRVVKNFDPTHLKQFPQKPEYMLCDEIEALKINEKLTEITELLNPVLLRLRIFVSKLGDTYSKTPDGKLPFKVKSMIAEADTLLKKINSISENIPRLELQKFNREYENYVSVTGMQSYAFKVSDGKEDYSVQFAPVVGEKYDNIKRLIVRDTNKKTADTFIISDDEYMVKNINKEYPAYIPERLVLASEDEINGQNFLPKFEKYLSLYLTELKNYISGLKKLSASRDSALPQEFDEKLQNSLKNFDSGLKSVLSKISGFSANKLSVLRGLCKGLDKISLRQGFSFYDEALDRTVQYLSMRQKAHENLSKIVITNNSDKSRQIYLIDGFKYLADNFNPKYPQVIPEKLTYSADTKSEGKVISEAVEFLQGVLKMVEVQADSMINPPKQQQPVKVKRVRAKRPAKIKISADKDYKELMKTCKRQLDEAMKSVDSGLDSFQKTLADIQSKITDFYASKIQ